MESPRPGSRHGPHGAAGLTPCADGQDGKPASPPQEDFVAEFEIEWPGNSRPQTPVSLGPPGEEHELFEWPSHEAPEPREAYVQSRRLTAAFGSRDSEASVSLENTPVATAREPSYVSEGRVGEHSLLGSAHDALEAGPEGEPGQSRAVAIAEWWASGQEKQQIGITSMAYPNGASVDFAVLAELVAPLPGYRDPRLGATKYTPDITNMKVHWEMPLKIHWTNPITKIHRTIARFCPWRHQLQLTWALETGRFAGTLHIINTNFVSHCKFIMI